MRTRPASWLKIFLVLFLNFNFTIWLQAQKLSRLHWPAGELVSVTGDTICGEITFYRDLETVRVMGPDKQDRAFVPSQVKYFTGRSKHNSQSFITLLWERNRDHEAFKVPAFFELLAEGNMCLVKRTMHTSYSEKSGGKVLQDQISSIPRQLALLNMTGSNFLPNGYATTPEDFYFLLDLSDKLTLLPQPKEDLLMQLNDKYPELDAYIRKNKLSLNDDRSLVKVVIHYNSLKEGK